MRFTISLMIMKHGEIVRYLHPHSSIFFACRFLNMILVRTLVITVGNVSWKRQTRGRQLDRSHAFSKSCCYAGHDEIDFFILGGWSKWLRPKMLRQKLSVGIPMLHLFLSLLRLRHPLSLLLEVSWNGVSHGTIHNSLRHHRSSPTSDVATT